MDRKGKLTLGSLFDGSGGFPLAGVLAGIEPVWASEVEPFAIRVTTKRFPVMEHHGDVSSLNGGEIEPVDIITFGSPCQNLSVAGNRKGLSGEESSLFFQAVRIIKEMRSVTDGGYPRFVVWENVPGAFSSNSGEDFREVLRAFCSIKEDNISIPDPPGGRWAHAGEIVADGFSLAWRVLDAQYWGVPQRRKRIFLVADLTGGCAGKILFESEGLPGHPAESIGAGQETAGASTDCAGAAGVVCLDDQGGSRISVGEDVSPTLRAQTHGHPPSVLHSAGFCTEHSAQARGIGYADETAPTIRAGAVPAVFENHSQDTRYTGPLDTAPTVSSTYGTGGNNQPFVVETPKTLKIRCGCAGGGKGALVQDDLSATLSCNNEQTLFVPKCYGICSKESHSMRSDNPKSGFYEAETTRCLDTHGSSPVCNQGGMVVVEGNGARPSHRGDGYSEDDVMYTLNTTEKHGVAYSLSKTSFFTQAEEEKTAPLVATDHKDPPVANASGYIVRRLTPTECARLQGFPDWWTDGLAAEHPFEEEIDWWAEVFEAHRRAVTRAKKPKTRKQIEKWLKDPYSDAAAYKMWGNGVALPCVYFVLSGIVYYAQFSGSDEGSFST